MASGSTSSKKQNIKASENNVSLEDLLGNTIQEDTEDEDYIQMNESAEDDGDESSDEETRVYKDSDGADIEDDTKPIIRKKSMKSVLKSKASSERMDELLKRNHTSVV
ncbi:hypothetical protein EVAR_73908_1 [Eumeta japonica]|uniref:Uncharacterized protein n=1 Tax=Eumeta variegata TaxID=151549 RepID=A0A4C1ST63_EUMVA|nr:hypothetical protein EVAR_73908_1 [Eumeta japonica]